MIDLGDRSADSGTCSAIAQQFTQSFDTVLTAPASKP